MKKLSYEDFSARIHSLSKIKRIPLNVSLSLTHRCNLKCVHCYCNLKAADSDAGEKESSLTEIMRILDELSAMGCMWILFTGGEPLLRNDFREIYLYAKQKGFIITIFSNGTLIDEGLISLLSEYPPFLLEISLYGATRETYENVTCTKGSYERCLNGIRKVVDAGINLKLKSMALTINQHEIKDMEKIADDFKCEFRFDPIVQKRIDGNNNSQPESYRISPEDVVRLDMTFPDRMEAYREFCDKYMQKPSDTGSLYLCGAGRGSMHIDPYGLAMGCMMMVKNAFSLREYELKWIWEYGILSVINRKKDFPLPCDDCNLIALCGQCSAWSILECGDVNKVVKYLCEIAMCRKSNFLFKNLKSIGGCHEKESMVKTGV